jgi:hypothetical protein
MATFFFLSKPHNIISIVTGDYSIRGPSLEQSRRQQNQESAKGPLEIKKLQREPSRSLSTTTQRPIAISSAVVGVAVGEEKDGHTMIPALRRYHRSLLHRRSAPLWTSIVGCCKQQHHRLWGSSAGGRPRHSSAQGASRRLRRGRAPMPQPSHRASRS